MSDGHKAVEIEDDLKAHNTLCASFLAGLVLVAANMILILFHFDLPRSSEDAFLAAKWSRVGPPLTCGESPNWEWLIVGDSSASLGIDPARLSRWLGGPCLNAATFGSMGLTGDVEMVKRFLKHHDPPRGIIVVHAADVLSQPLGDAFYQYSATLPQSFLEMMTTVAPTLPNGSQWVTLFRSRGYLPLLLLKNVLREKIGWEYVDSSNAVEPGVELPIDGTCRLDASHANLEKVQLEADSYFDSELYVYDTFDSCHQVALDRLVELAQLHGVQLIYANGPIADAVRNRPEFDRNMAVSTKAVEDSLQSHPQTHYLLQQWIDLPSCQMESPNHPTGSAIDDYTDVLGDAIANVAL